MISDHYGKKWEPYINQPTAPCVPPVWTHFPPNPGLGMVVTREEFEALRKDVLEMKELMKKAIDYDRRNNEPACAASEKVALLKRIAELVGVDMQDIIDALQEGNQPQTE